MKIPYVEAKDRESDNVVQGFYFEFPETTYCFTEDYEREPKVKLIPCVMSHRMTDWGLPNVPIICKPIDKSTLKIIGYIDTDNDYYIPTKYVIKKLAEEYNNGCDYDVEKVVTELDNAESVKVFGSLNSGNRLIPVKDAIEIVRKGGAK